MTRSIAAGYARDAIRANAIAPGRTLTPRVRAVSEDSEHALKLNPRHLLGLLDPMDIANMFVFLASEEARHLTGQVIPVDSGMTVS
jgi:NAD(P)-dependent dehydrogenase (short-subunit alcohol dehydrogenase family)